MLIILWLFSVSEPLKNVWSVQTLNHKTLSSHHTCSILGHIQMKTGKVTQTVSFTAVVSERQLLKLSGTMLVQPCISPEQMVNQSVWNSELYVFLLHVVGKTIIFKTGGSFRNGDKGGG